MSAAAKPDLMEQYVVGVQASGLTLDELTERPLDRVAAMGAASAAIAMGDQDSRLTLAAMALRPRGDVEHEIAAELSRVLWRLQGKGRPDPEQMGRASVLFAGWLTLQRRFADLAPGLEYRMRLEPFAQRVIYEWLFRCCGKCGGSGHLQLTRKGAVKTLGSMARNTRFVQCGLCFGSGQGLPNRVEQASALRLNVKVFDDAGWSAFFRLSRVWLHKLLRRPARHLRRELERR